MMGRPGSGIRGVGLLLAGGLDAPIPFANAGQNLPGWGVAVGGGPLEPAAPLALVPVHALAPAIEPGQLILGFAVAGLGQGLPEGPGPAVVLAFIGGLGLIERSGRVLTGSAQ